jgi:hypothetical protein
MVSELVAKAGQYGMVSSVSSRYGVSRETLYSWKEKGKAALREAFTPKQERREEEVNIERAVLILFTEGHASYRGIQVCLESLLGIRVSIGKITSIVQNAGKRAHAWMERLVPEGLRAIAVDEQYGSERGEAYLNIVDVHSGLVLASIPPVPVDGESWELLFLQMEEQGLKWHIVSSDGGRAIQDAVDRFKLIQDEEQELPLKPRHQRDTWHVLDECWKGQNRLDRQVQQLKEQTKTVERQAARVATGKKPVGKNPKTDVQEHKALVSRAEYAASSVHYLTRELQRLLSVVVLASTPELSILSSKSRREELDALLVLLSELSLEAPAAMKCHIDRLRKHIESALPRLLSFVEDLDEVQQKALQEIGAAAVHLIGWAWLHRAILGQRSQLLLDDFPPEWRENVRELLSAWGQTVRASSCVENWHSVLRPFLAVHRSLSAGMLALLAVWHNHRVAPRGDHQGQSPLQRSGLQKQPTDWLGALGYPPATPRARHLVSLQPDLQARAA